MSHTVVLGVVGNDIHVVANRILEICLRAASFTTINLGTNNMPENFADAALETGADCVLVGSLNGEAGVWCGEFRHLFEARGIGDIVIYVGGNLTTGQRSAASVEKLFRHYRIDRIFTGTTDFDVLIDTLKEDLDGRPQP